MLKSEKIKLKNKIIKDLKKELKIKEKIIKNLKKYIENNIIDSKLLDYNY